MPGERVVTKGNFLIDSQTRLTGSITGMFGGSKAFGTEAQSTQAPSQNYTVTLRPGTVSAERRRGWNVSRHRDRT